MASMKSEIEDKILTCPLCLNVLTDPKCLPCIHTFCLECLKMHVQHTSQRGMFLCPECRETVWMKQGGVEEFRTNFFINRLKDMKFNMAPTEVELPCRLHPSKSMSLFCDECNVCVCADCIVQKHKGHPCSSFADARTDREKTLKNRLNDLELATNAAKDSLQGQTAKIDAVRKRQSDGSDNVKAAVQRLVEEIQNAASATIRNLGEITEPVLDQHIHYLDELKTHTEQLESDMAKMHLAVKKSSDAEMLDAYKDTVDRVTNICMMNYGSKEENLQKSVAHLKHSYNEVYGKFSTECKNLIKQMHKDLTEENPGTKLEQRNSKKRLSFKGKGKTPASEAAKTPPKLGKKSRDIGRPSTDQFPITGLCVHAKSGNIFCCIGDKAYKYGGLIRKWKDIHSRLKIGNEAVCDVHEHGEFVVFSVRSEGVTAKCKVVRFNPESSAAEVIQLDFSSNPPGLCVCKDKTLLVTDLTLGLIRRVSWDGERIDSLGGRTMRKPWYVTQTSSGNIVACDNMGKSDVFLLGADGTFLKSLKNETEAQSAEYGISDPYSVRVDRYDRIYVACCWSNSVLVFSDKGDYLSALITPDHHITHPVSLHLTDDKIYIGHKDGVSSFSIS
ncbi:uncharacterized protein LOC135464738 [Liolophura sinensis]|uniref:uncharacterized protein LOC135464738 n=1 Tax=Liolophura sinensis TaxID=3198878 RepID=UPI003158CB1D